ncbi:peroxisomal catalase 1-like [Maniola jurtina]|uniref:peroxisomal catalase 1-like n=1 Tax=Maniola jurtina TaxID=191418 RepID=UPI001E686CF2|nr:peroxisomal catalase 1-like [Maniola jurtina]
MLFQSPVGLMSVSNGAPVTYCEANNSLNEPLLRNTFYMDHMTSQTRERTYGRSVHTKGAGAFGYFEVTHDISHICKASFLSEVGKKTPVAVRFSPATGEVGGSDLERGARGFAIKFYTDEGNFDLPGLNMPMFFIKDPAMFAKFVYSLRKDPALYLFNPMGLWDIIIANPAALSMFLLVFGDRGIPASYRHMAGYNLHTLQVENAQGVQSFMRWTYTPRAGVKGLGTAEAQKIKLVDLDYYSRDLFESIKTGDYPCWEMGVQIVTEEDVKRCGYGVFDIMRKLNETEFPLHPVGEMCLNRNPKNYFSEIEQLAFCPANLVNGIHGAPDRMYEARRLAYKDAQLRRLGPDVDNIPVNCPLHVSSDNPDSRDGAVGYESTQRTGLIKIIEEEPYTFDQAAHYYVNELSSEERDRTIETIISMLTPAGSSVQEQMIELFTTVSPELGSRVAEGLSATKTK